MVKSGIQLPAIAFAVSWVLLADTSFQPTPAPTVYRTTSVDATHRTLIAGVYGAPAGKTPVGEVVDGFTLSLTASRSTLRSGDGLTFTVELRNVSNVGKSTSLSAKDASYFFNASNTNTGNVNLGIVTPHFGPPAAFKFAPRTSLYLWFRPQVANTVQEPGRYTLQAQVAFRGLTLSSNVVTVNILPRSDGKPVLNWSDPSQPSASGPTEHGVALSILTPAAANVYRVGSPIWITTAIRNATPGEIGLIFLFADSYTMEITDLRSGRRLPLAQDWADRPDAFSGSFGSRNVPKGESHFQAIRLDRLFKIATPGRYLVRATATFDVQPESATPSPPRAHVALRSNPLQIDVLPPRSPTPISTQGPQVYEAEPGQQLAGRASNGFALSLTNDGPNNTLGGPILVTVELRNISGQTQDAFFGSPTSDYHFTIVNRQTGELLEREPQATSQGDLESNPWDSRPVHSDTSLYSRFELNQLYRFAEGETYTIRVTGRPVINGQRVTLESNPVEVALATPTAPPPTLALPETSRVLSFKIQTNRPVYASGEPVLVRLAVTNLGKEPVAYNPLLSHFPNIISVVNPRNKPVPTGRGGRVTILRTSMTWPSLSPGTTRLGWFDMDTWGYHLTEPGTYAISARPEIYGRIFTPSATYTVTSDNASGAPPIKIQILTKEAARTEPAYNLDDANLDATFHSLMREYERLRSTVRDLITRLQSGARQSDLFYKSGNWQTEQEDFEGRIDGLPSSGNVDSPYVLLSANLWSAASALGAAGNSVLYSCDPAGAGANLKVADYFLDAVRRELSAGETNAGDAAYPPSEASPKGHCTR